MNEKVIITDNELSAFGVYDSFAGKVRTLLSGQSAEWDLLKNGIRSLKEAEIKTFDFKDFLIKVQFNKQRIASSTAKVDEKSINNRKCFLCTENLPSSQRGVLYKDNFLVLCNPYPIFNEHFTLPCVSHIPQSIKESIPVLLDFGKDLSRFYTVLYNGPKCGASAPDHLHFQAGEKFTMPLDSEYDRIKINPGALLFKNKQLEVYTVEKYLRRFVSFESGSKEVLTKALGLLLAILEEVFPSGEEPMVNILVSFSDDKWRTVVFPREKHRPSFFYMEGEDNILLSPGSVDMGGLLITPMEKDFKKITKQNIIDIFDEVTISEGNFQTVKESLEDRLRTLSPGN